MVEKEPAWEKPQHVQRPYGGIKESKVKLVRNEGLGEQPVMPGLVELGSHARAPQALASFIKTFQSLPRAPGSAVAVRGT